MQMTAYEALARDYHSKWCACLETIQKQRDEIEALKEELTQERRERYRLLDMIHQQKEEALNHKKGEKNENRIRDRKVQKSAAHLAS